jgi:hypothetical protein
LVTFSLILVYCVKKNLTVVVGADVAVAVVVGADVAISYVIVVVAAAVTAAAAVDFNVVVDVAKSFPDSHAKVRPTVSLTIKCHRCPSVDLQIYLFFVSLTHSVVACFECLHTRSEIPFCHATSAET